MTKQHTDKTAPASQKSPKPWHAIDYKAIEQAGYDEASEQFKTQGCFSSGRTWSNALQHLMAITRNDEALQYKEAREALARWEAK